MSLIDLLAIAFCLWLSVMAGSFVYDHTESLTLGVVAGMGGFWAVPALLVGGGWLHDMLKRRRAGKLISLPGSEHAEAESKGRLDTLLQVVVPLIPVGVGQVFYSATKDRSTSLAAAVVALAFASAVLAGVFRGRRRSERR